MVLTFRELKKEWSRGKIKFDPDIDPKQIGLSSIDLRLGCVFTKLKDVSGVVIQPVRGFDPTDLVTEQDFSKTKILGKMPSFKLGPRDFCLANTLEKLFIPNNMVGNVQGKSSIARAGLAVHLTAPVIHPGWSGNITLNSITTVHGLSNFFLVRI